jgi:sec-independent protein translocase protein TatB
VHGREPEAPSGSASSSGSTGGRVDMSKKPEAPARDERPPFDADAT